MFAWEYKVKKGDSQYTKHIKKKSVKDFPPLNEKLFFIKMH